MIHRAAPYLLLAGAVLIASLRLWAIDYPPLIDWPNHLARHAIQCGDAEFGRQAAYYDFTLRLVPNLTADLVYALPGACNDIFLTQKLLIQFAMLGLIGSSFMLHFAIWRRLSIWPGLAVLLVFNQNFGYGFENYVLAAPLAIALLALWVMMIDGAIWRRTLVVLPLAAVLYVFHVYAFIFFGVMMGALEVQRAWQSRRSAPRPALLRLLASALVGLGPALHFLLLQGETQGPDLGITIHGGLMSRLGGLMSLVSPQSFFLLDGAERQVAILSMLALGLIGLGGYRLATGFVFDRRFTLAAIFGALLFLGTPSVLATVHFTNVRYPVLIVIVLLAASRPAFGKRANLGLSVCIAAAFIGMAEARRQAWQAHDAELREMLTASAVLAPDDRVLVLRRGVVADVIRHTHSPAHIAMQSGAFFPILFTGANPLVPRDAIAQRATRQYFPPEVSEMLAPDGTPKRVFRHGMLVNWDSYYTHVLVLHARDAMEDPVPALGLRIQSGRVFDLYYLAPGGPHTNR